MISHVAIGDRPRWRFLAIALSAVIAMVCFALPAGAAFPGHNGRIAFSSFRHGHVDILTMQPDGTSIRNLTQDPQPDFQPAWSPDGDRIAYVTLHVEVSHFSQIWTMNPRGHERLRLTDFEDGNPQEPSWSPDGSQIAFHVSFGGAIDDEIYVIDADGSDLLQLTDNRLSDSNPAWSPDGELLAFVRDGAVMTMHPDGTHIAPVTPDGTFGFEPAWDPDGRQLVFAGTQGSFSNIDLFTVRTDGTHLKQITHTLKTESTPCWSPNGRRIVYVRTKIHDESDTQQDRILTMLANGSHRRVLSVAVDTRDATPDWRTLH